MRKYYTLLSLLFLLTGYFLSSVYRPYVYKNNIQDFGIADAGNNIIFVPGVYFLLLLARDKPLISYYYDILLIWGVYVFIEILQFLKLFPGTFDVNDLIGLTVGTMFTYLISKKIHKSFI